MGPSVCRHASSLFGMSSRSIDLIGRLKYRQTSIDVLYCVNCNHMTPRQGPADNKAVSTERTVELSQQQAQQLYGVMNSTSGVTSFRIDNFFPNYFRIPLTSSIR
jgi:hypothetical protein